MKKATAILTNVVSALTARTQFGQIMRRAAAKNERFLVDRRGEPAVIIMSVSDYMETFAPEPDWLSDIRANSKRNSTNNLPMARINNMIAEVRQVTRKTLTASIK